MLTDLEEAPTGRVAARAAEADDDVVWLPAEVSARKRWIRAVLSLALLTVPALTLFVIGTRPVR